MPYHAICVENSLITAATIVSSSSVVLLSLKVEPSFTLVERPQITTDNAV